MLLIFPRIGFPPGTDRLGVRPARIAGGPALEALSRGIAALAVGFGEYLGRAFQIRDDLLDAVGDEENFGKEIGSDIRERKKTYLFVTALERARGGDRSFLGSLRTRNGISSGVIERVQAIYLRTGTLEAAARAVKRSTMRAQESLKPIKPGRGKELLLWLSQRLLERVS